MPAHARGNTQDQYAHRDDQRARPRQVLPILVGAQGELKDDHRQIRHGRIQIGAPELVVERREQQGRRLAADAGDGQQQTRDDAAARRRIQHAHDGSPRIRAERRGGILHADGHEIEHVLGGAQGDGIASMASASAPAMAEKWPMRTTTIS
jgi:hypothetical protein